MAGLLAGGGYPLRVLDTCFVWIFAAVAGRSARRRVAAYGRCFPARSTAAFRGRALPDGNAARRRIERASGLQHRPLQTLADQPSTSLDPLAARLWEAHQQRMADAARRLRIGIPAAGFAARDPRGLRAVLAILLLLAAIDAGGDWRDRLVRAATPSLAIGAPAVAASLDIWLTPPEYTALPPQFLKAGSPKTIRVPIGSTLLAQVHGGRRYRNWRSTAKPPISTRSTSRISVRKRH